MSIILKILVKFGEIVSNMNFIAVDLGATSGRVILATLGDGSLGLETLHRFPTPLVEKDGKFYWDYDSLCKSIVEGLAIAGGREVKIESIGIDTWGVDFVRFDADGKMIEAPRSYRDPYTVGVPEKFFAEMPRELLFAKTGIQVMNFNSVFQMYAQKEQYPQTAHIHFLPDALGYFLTGNMVTESTILSTSALTDATTALPDAEICKVAGVTPGMFGKVVQPGTVLGTLKKEIADKCGLGPVPVVTVAGHDTASAVAAVPAGNSQFAYLSSGTWSLMGIEVPQPIINKESARLNYTNEGGIEGTTRFLKNITGMWLLEQCRKVWSEHGKNYSYDQLHEMARSEKDFAGRIDPDNPRFANPGNMVAEICKVIGFTVSDAQIVSCIYHSLADKYAQVLENLRSMDPFPIDCLHIIGGGSVNETLNQWTADAVGIPVLAGPSEATAIGNVMMQAAAAGLSDDRWAMRRLIAKAFPPKKYLPGGEA